MKNVFVVVNKEKIYAYVVSILTIVILFFMSSMIDSDFEETQSTSSNIVENVYENSENNTNNSERMNYYKQYKFIIRKL